MGLKDTPKLMKAYLAANVKRGVEHKVTQKIRDMKEFPPARSLGHRSSREIITDIRQIEEIKQTSMFIGFQKAPKEHPCRDAR